MSLKFKELGVVPTPALGSCRALSEIDRRDLWDLAFRGCCVLFENSSLQRIAGEPYYYVSFEMGIEGVLLVDDHSSECYFVYYEK
jgi:hypothetical protein